MSAVQGGMIPEDDETRNSVGSIPSAVDHDADAVELLADDTAEVTCLSVSLKRVRLSRFEEATPLSEEERSAYRRRFITLFVEEGSCRRGGLGKVERAHNALGETFALKTLVLPEGDGPNDEDHARADALVASFRREYEEHRKLSGLRGFPRLYGFGWVGDAPAIVMEWIEGETLANASRRLAVDDEGRLSPLAAACIGSSLFALLARMDLVGNGFVHRDVSPSNVMVRTGRLALEEQAEEGEFDLCLVDFGSSRSLEQAADKSSQLTASGGSVQCATAAYAPPEMLGNDLENLAKLRMSPAIDVFAAASVVYELAGGGVPFDLAGHHAAASAGEKPLSYYRIKVDHMPKPLRCTHAAAESLSALLVRERDVALAAAAPAVDLGVEPDSAELRRALCTVDGQLTDMLVPCLSSDQRKRPTAEAMRDGLAAFCANYAENVSRALRGAPLIPCTGSAGWLDSASPYALRRIVRSAGKAVSFGVLAVVAVATGLLLDGAQAAVALGPFAWQGAVSGIAISALLVFPALCAYGARGWHTASAGGFLRGTVGLLCGAAVSLAALSCWAFDVAARMQGLYAGLFAACAAAWCPIVLDYAMTVVPAIVAEARRRLTSATEPQEDVLPGAGVMRGISDGNERQRKA